MFVEHRLPLSFHTPIRTLCVDIQQEILSFSQNLFYLLLPLLFFYSVSQTRTWNYLSPFHSILSMCNKLSNPVCFTTKNVFKIHTAFCPQCFTAWGQAQFIFLLDCFSNPFKLKFSFLISVFLPFSSQSVIFLKITFLINNTRLLFLLFYNFVVLQFALFLLSIIFWKFFHDIFPGSSFRSTFFLMLH